MIDKIIRFSINNKLIIGLMVLFLVGWGIYSLTRLPVDAVPDITNNQVQIISVAPTLAANEVEQFITAPIEISVVNIPDIIELRSISRLGLSVVTVVFKDHVDIYKARQLIGERLSEAESQIPEGLTTPELAPVSTGLGEIYQYFLRVKPGYHYSIMDLRTTQDWIVRRELLGTPGVADVNSYGGMLKQYEIAVNPERLHSMNISLTDIFNALGKNNQNTGSAYIEKNPTAFFIRGIGLVSSLSDIEQIPVKTTSNGLPVLIRDVAKVQFGNAPRYGTFVVDTIGEAVGGVVMMLKGENGSQVIANVEKRIETVQKSLPEGIEIVPYLDRTDLVGRAIGTVSRNLIEGGLIVIFVLVLLLGSLRAGLVVASVIPLAMLFAVSMMNLFGVSGNLMSLGALDFGLIVDGAVIIVESVVHRITQGKLAASGITKLSKNQMDEEVYHSSKRMMNSATFGQIIILIVYLPILALVGTEGKMFRPMAETVSFAIIGALILSLTYVPVASALFLSPSTQRKPNISDKIMTGLHRAFEPLLNLALKRKITVVIVSIVLFVLSILLYNSLGGEFLPNLEEGDLASSVITLQGGSLEHTTETVEKANKILMSQFPEVKHAICKIGAAEIPTDPTPMETGDYIIVMKDKSEWTSASTREEMMEKMEKALAVLPGVVFEFQQPIQMRFNELMTGTKQDVAIKIFGDNLETLATKASQVENIIKTIPGIVDINVEKVTGSGQVQVIYNREKMAQYGINIADVNDLLKTAFAGNSAGVVYDEEKRFDMVVRFDKDFRNDIEYIKSMYIPLPNGNQIPLDQIASVEIKNGTAQVSRESTRRRINVGFNVRNRDVQTIINEVQAKIDKQLKLPAGYYVTFGGQFENLEAAKQRLAIAVPVALLLIFVLLFFTFHSIKQTLLIYSAVPLSAIGGIAALYLRNMNFSISAGVGFIALFGVAVLNGIVLIAEFNRLEHERGITDIYERVRKGMKTRLRPVIITASVASLGFLPMALSTSAGAEVQKPLATVVIGGLISATLLTLIVLPVLYILFSNKKKINSGITSKSLITILVIGSSLIFSQGVMAQQKTIKTITLEQAINQALQNNGNIKSATMHVDLQKKLVNTAWDIGKTNIDLVYGQSNSLKKDNNISISQDFSFPGLYVNQTRLAKANVNFSETELAAAKKEIQCNVKATYYQLVYLNARLKQLNHQDSLYTEFYKAASLSVEKGESPLLEKTSAETQLMELKTRKSQILSDITIFGKRLQTMLNEKEDIAIAESSPVKLSLILPSDSSALAENPSLALLRQQIEISRRETGVERAKLYPDFNIGYFSQSIIGYQEANGESHYYSSSDRFTGLQAGIRIPLWFSPQAAKIQAAKINENIAKNNLEYSQNEMNNRLAELYEEYQKYKTSLDFYEKTALPQSELIIKQAGKSYFGGSINYVEYIQNIEKALEIESDYLENLNGYNQAIISIEYLIGTK